jgi:hypothetical protein
VKYGCPEVFNTDQGSQFTSEAFLNELKLRNIRTLGKNIISPALMANIGDNRSYLSPAA